MACRSLQVHRNGHGCARRSAAGAAIVELVVCLPVLIAILVGTADFARVFYYTIELTNAARAGAQYAGYNSVQAAQTAEITAAAENAAPNISPIVVTLASPPGVCKCAADDPSSTTPLLIDPTPASCGPSTCPSGRHMFETVTITVSKTFSTLSPFPGIPQTLTLTRTATNRVAL